MVTKKDIDMLGRIIGYRDPAFYSHIFREGALTEEEWDSLPRNHEIEGDLLDFYQKTKRELREYLEERRLH